MATGHFFKTSNDVGAPDLIDGAGSLIAVLDWALDVAGGTHWEKVFSGTNKAVYRPTTGIRPYLRVVDDESSEGATTSGATVRMYASMSDVDTGLGVCPAAGHDDAQFYWHKKLRQGATPAFYVVAGDSRGVYLHVENNTGDSSWDPVTSGYFFGEPVPLDPTDSYSACLIGNGPSVTSTSTTDRFFPRGGWVASLENSSTPRGGNAGDQPACWLKSPTGTTDGVGLRAWSSSWVGGRVADGPVTHAWPFYLVSLQDGVSADADTTGYARGRLPYAYDPTNWNLPSGWAIGDTLDFGGSTFLIVKSDVSTNDDEFYLIRSSNDEPGRV